MNTNSPYIPITVYVEQTPNPKTMKFVANMLLVKNSFDFYSKAMAEQAPIAKYLFKLDYVSSVFIAKNYVTITINDEFAWEEVMMEMRDHVNHFLKTNKTLVTDREGKENLAQTQDLASKQIAALIEQHVKPLTLSDGGNITFKKYNPDTKIVEVIMQGACYNCPSIGQTLKTGVEAMLQDMLPGKVIGVKPVKE
jgi:Fe-S cluster biogenesis protein NfuA